ncbi:MAG: hypothetical protein EB015_21715 [Methylocystaceae bacterium]|nr:hypothetical protein [Methylocystaceae bacterium]
MHYADNVAIGPWNDEDARFLTEDDALERFFRRVISEKEAREIFSIVRSKFDIIDATLHLVDRMCPKPPCKHRDLADADLETHVIRMAKRVLMLGEGQFVGLLAHEFGHLADPTPRKPMAEKRADRIAYKALGVPIRYDRCDVQTIGPGKPARPSHLHQ